MLNLRQREEEISLSLKVNKNNKTWIIDSMREHLNTEEINSGFKGPINTLSEALELCQSGDTLFIHSGEYEINFDHFPDKNIQIVGCDENVEIIKNEEIVDDELHIESNIYFKNIALNMNELMVTKGSTLWMEDCSLTFCAGAGIEIEKDANFQAFNCSFIGECDQGDHGAIVAKGNIEIIDCEFSHCGGFENRPCIQLINTTNQQKLKLIGNVFDELFNHCNPIGDDHGEWVELVRYLNNPIFMNNKIFMNSDGKDILYNFVI